MILTIDVGNTEIACGLFEGDERRGAWRIATGGARTGDEWALLLEGMLRLRGLGPDAVGAVAMGSVVPSVTVPLRDAAAEIFGVQALVVDSETPLPITLEVDAPSTVGADRILNTLAVRERFGRDAVVVDLGTATTFDCITAEGAFIGGVIAPGVETAADALLRRAARLARFEGRRPATVIGRTTEACLQSGIFWGAVDTIDGIVDRIRREWEKPEALVLATGGLAGSLAPACRTIERVEPWLTLEGLLHAHRHAGLSLP